MNKNLNQEMTKGSITSRKHPHPNEKEPQSEGPNYGYRYAWELDQTRDFQTRDFKKQHQQGD